MIEKIVNFFRTFFKRMNCEHTWERSYFEEIDNIGQIDHYICIHCGETTHDIITRRD